MPSWECATGFTIGIIQAVGLHLMKYLMRVLTFLRMATLRISLRHPLKIRIFLPKYNYPEKEPQLANNEVVEAHLH